MNFYERFAQLCAQKGVTMARACTDMGMNPSITWRWKEATPSNKTLQKLCVYFELTYNDLLSDVPYKPRTASKVTGTGSLFDMLDDTRVTAVMRLIMESTPEQKQFLRDLLDAYDAY